MRLLSLCFLAAAIAGCSSKPPEPPVMLKPTPPVQVKKFVVYDFWASWCPPCKTFSPVFDQWKKKHSNENVSFVKVNVDEDKETASKFKISVLPTVIVTSDGKEVGRFHGVPSEKQVTDLLRQ